MGIHATNIGNYTDFKTIIADFPEKGRVYYLDLTSGSSLFYASYISVSAEFSVSATISAGSPPATFATDFPQAVAMDTTPPLTWLVEDTDIVARWNISNDGMVILAQSYNDFKAIIGALPCAGGRVFYVNHTTAGSRDYEILFVSDDNKYVVGIVLTSADGNTSISAPTGFSTDFPAAVGCDQATNLLTAQSLPGGATGPASSATFWWRF